MNNVTDDERRTPVPTVPCSLCNNPTHMPASKLCGRCWELKNRIERDPDIARKILKDIK